MPKREAITNQREQEILREIQLAGGSCRIGFLARQLKVSDETIRRNIKSLQTSGLVNKVHGGVSLAGSISLVETPFQRRMDRSTETKKALAAAVADMIKDGESVFLDTGSTVAFVAQALQSHKNLYIVTNSISVAHMLTGRNNNRVFFAGGELRRLDGAAFGQDALNLVKRFNFKYAVSSVAAINAESGLTLFDIKEVDMTSAAIKRAQVSIIVADSAKFGISAPVSIQPSQKFCVLVTDAKPDKPIAAMLKKNKISLDVVS